MTKTLDHETLLAAVAEHAPGFSVMPATSDREAGEASPDAVLVAPDGKSGVELFAMPSGVVADLFWAKEPSLTAQDGEPTVHVHAETLKEALGKVAKRFEVLQQDGPAYFAAKALFERLPDDGFGVGDPSIDTARSGADPVIRVWKQLHGEDSGWELTTEVSVMPNHSRGGELAFHLGVPELLKNSLAEAGLAQESIEKVTTDSLYHSVDSLAASLKHLCVHAEEQVNELDPLYGAANKLVASLRHKGIDCDRPTRTEAGDLEVTASTVAGLACYEVFGRFVVHQSTPERVGYFFDGAEAAYGERVVFEARDEDKLDDVSLKEAVAAFRAGVKELSDHDEIGRRIEAGQYLDAVAAKELYDELGLSALHAQGAVSKQLRGFALEVSEGHYDLGKESPVPAEHRKDVKEMVLGMFRSDEFNDARDRLCDRLEQRAVDLRPVGFVPSSGMMVFDVGSPNTARDLFTCLGGNSVLPRGGAGRESHISVPVSLASEAGQKGEVPYSALSYALGAGLEKRLSEALWFNMEKVQLTVAGLTPEAGIKALEKERSKGADSISR